jgi:hypothetical protein
MLKIILEENKREILIELRDYINIFNRALANILLKYYLIKY